MKLAMKKFAKALSKKGNVKVPGQINEISVERMKAYKAKAGESWDKARKDYDDPKKREEANKTIGKRNSGIWTVKARTDHLKEDQLNEISKERLKSYVKKAVADHGEKSQDMGRHSAGGSMNFTSFMKHRKGVEKRHKGIEKATDKLVAEEIAPHEVKIPKSNHKPIS